MRIKEREVIYRGGIDMNNNKRMKEYVKKNKDFKLT